MIKKCLLMMAVALLAAGNLKADTINNFIVGVYNKGDFSLVLDMFQNRDTAGLAQFVTEGKGEILQRGTFVSDMDYDLFSNMCKVRARGSSQGVWVPQEFVTHAKK
jgi:hypothetical protein